MQRLIINRGILVAEIYSDDLDLLNDITDAIDKIIDEYYPNAK